MQHSLMEQRQIPRFCLWRKERMDKRKVENLRVRTAIADALFELLEHKAMASISVSEIVARANVARASFYRNYNSKEDVLTGYIQDVLKDFKNDSACNLSECYELMHVQRTLEFFQTHRHHVLVLHNAGYSSLFLDELNDNHVSVYGNMGSNSLERYKLFVFTGALYNVAVHWLQEERPASPREVAAVFLASLNPTQ